jgi:Pre-mRNA 3'-end-processing endonuclease polyadenylation factor C-term
VGCDAEDEGNEVLMVAGLVKVIHIPAAVGRKEGGVEGPYGRVVLEWDSGPLSDCVADSVVSILLQEQGQPAAIGAAEQQRECAHPHF